MRRRIAVTGLGCVSPLGNDVPSTWAGLAAGRSAVGRITRFDPSGFRSQMAGEVRNFDPSGVIAAADRKKMDVFIQYALAAAAEALEDSGLDLRDERTQEETGVSVGVSLGGIATIERTRATLIEKGPRRISPFFLPAILGNMAAGFISTRFKTRNYNASIASACSSSNHSIGNAARLIERGDARAMIAGGAEAVISPLVVGGFSAMHALSTRNDDPARASRPYDAERDGFVMGEGAAVLILEDYEHARARGARIYGDLAGYGYSADAHHITAPNVEGPALAIARALRDAEVQPEEVDYINTHGTSTPPGDLNELRAIKRAFGPAAYGVSLSSSKSMAGHLLGAAGAFEAVATLMAMQHGVVPPTINIETLDPECDLDVTPNTARERPIRVALSNSFGFGGTNATLAFKAA